MRLPCCQGKRSTVNNLLGRHLLAQPWCEKNTVSAEVSLVFMFLTGLFGVYLLLQPHHAYTSLGTLAITKDSPCNLLCSLESQGMLSTAPHLCIAASVELFHTDKTPYVKSPKCSIQMSVGLHLDVRVV